MLAVALPAAVEGDARRSVPDLLEPQAAEVAEQEVGRGVVGDEQVEPAVVVEVGDRQAQAAPARGTSRPASRLTSVNVPSPLLRKRWSACAGNRPGEQWIGWPSSSRQSGTSAGSAST